MKKYMAAIVLMLVVVLNACGMQARKDNKPIQTEKLENVNQNKTLESEKSEGATSTDKKTKEVYNCCGFITDTGVTVKFGGVAGTELIGLVKLLDNAKQDKTVNGYDFKMLSNAEELEDKLLSGELDMIVLPMKAGVKLYNEMDSKVRLLVTGKINIDKKQEKSNNKKHMIAGVFTTEDYIRENKNAVDAFLGDYRYSAIWITDKENRAEAVKLIEEYNIAKADRIKKIVSSKEKACITGEEMKAFTEDYLSSVKKKGKKEKFKLPKADFYYIKDTK